MTAFEEFGVLPEIAKAVEEMEWLLPTDVQSEAIPLILGGGDVLMAAETGSGKTGAFCLPIVQIVWETLKDLAEGKGKKTGGVGGTLAAPSWTMSFYDRGDALVVAPDGLRCQSRDLKDWHGCRATTGVRGVGKFYFEAVVSDEGLCRVGWSTQKASLDLGTDRFSFGFGGTGKKSHNRQFDDYGESFHIHDTIGCLLDLTRMEVHFSKNGKAFGLAFRVPDQLKNDTFYPAVLLKNAEMIFNFGNGTAFKYVPPNDVVGVAQATAKNVQNNPMTGVQTSSFDMKSKTNAPQAIIIEPSRELAEQTFNQLRLFKKFLKDPVIKELLLIGGVAVREQLATLQNGVDIIVATPGRLEDMISGGQVSLTHCRFFVLDEADGLFQAGFSELIINIHKQIPKITWDGRRLQMIVCSATLHAFEVKRMAERLMTFPTWIDLKGEDVVPETVHHVVALVDPMTDQRWHALCTQNRRHIQTDAVHAGDVTHPGANTPEMFSEAVKILKAEYLVQAIEENQMDRALFFCRTKLDCDNLERYLKQIDAKRYSCAALHADRTPKERKANLQAFKDGKVHFLICTDVAARGLDIVGLPFTINFTLPDEKSNYVHRIGRVGRADRMGLAISLVSTVPEKVWYHGQWCPSRGKNCKNTQLTDVKGCCIWYNEKNCLAEIEDHLNIIVQQVDKNMIVPTNEFDGKVVYGDKKQAAGSGYKDHVNQLVPVVQRLAELESKAQGAFLHRTYLL